MSLDYFGISTHNLKNIDFSINDDHIVLLKGVSGCGKSSLAIDTIYQISEDELAQMTNRLKNNAIYSVQGYTGILPGICLRQENYNTNPRSTIGTYFCINQFFQNIFSYISSMPREYFRFSNPDIACPDCKGLGTVSAPSLHDIIDLFAPLSAKCFKVWRNKDSELYSKLFDIFCEENNIPISGTFYNLSDEHKKKILYGESAKKYSIRYKCNKIKHSRTRKYEGPILFLENLLKKNKITPSMKKYFIDEECFRCHGSRFSEKINQYKIWGKTIADIYLMEFKSLFNFLNVNLNKSHDSYIKRQCSPILNFLKASINVKLEYLNFNRAIPSLSGGELQRLCMAKASISHFNRFLYVLDEPTSSLHPTEWKLIAKILLKIREQHNTLLMIEHSSAFDEIADKIVYIGPGAGINGGQIVSKNKISSLQYSNGIRYSFFKKKSSINIRNECFNTVKISNIDIPYGTLTGICGVSGSGKTSFAKKILAQYTPNSTYANQEPLKGNSYSIVATALNVLKDISCFFANETNRHIKNFSYYNKGPGQCSYCNGIGRIVEKNINWVSENECPNCKGMRYSKKALSIYYKEYNIYDFLNLDIDTVISLLPEKHSLAIKLRIVSRIGLGYLKLFQRINTLSGGEAQRIKIAAIISKYKRSRTYILDEPFRGIDAKNSEKIISLLYDLVRQNNSVYLIEHDPTILSFCSYLIELGPSSGSSGGRILYSGEKDKINNTVSSIATFIN